MGSWRTDPAPTGEWLICLLLDTEKTAGPEKGSFWSPGFLDAASKEWLFTYEKRPMPWIKVLAWQRGPELPHLEELVSLSGHPDSCAGCEWCPTLDELFADIADWAIPTFPKATPASWVKHLEKEVKELAVDPSSEEEIADCIILLAGLAAKQGIDARAAVARKLEINKARKWGEPDADGVVEHVREPREPASHCSALDEVLKDAGLKVAFGLRQQGKLEQVHDMIAEGKTWDEIGIAIGWDPGVAERLYWIESEQNAPPVWPTFDYGNQAQGSLTREADAATATVSFECDDCGSCVGVTLTLPPKGGMATGVPCACGTTYTLELVVREGAAC